MFLPTVRGAARLLSLVLAWVVLLPLSARSADNAPPVDLFAAIAAADLEVTAIPRDETRITVQLKNNTARPLSIRIPAAFAAAPVLPQFGMFPGLQQNNNNNNNQAAQQLGAGNNPFGQQNNNNNFNPGIFNVPAGKVIKLRLPCVCLEHGKPTPNSRMAYELKPLAQVNDRPEVAATLAAMSEGKISRRVAQLAAWHYANGKSWKELAALRNERFGGFPEPQFFSAEIAQAQNFAETLAKELPPKQSSTSLSQR